VQLGHAAGLATCSPEPTQKPGANDHARPHRAESDVPGRGHDCIVAHAGDYLVHRRQSSECLLPALMLGLRDSMRRS